MTSFFHVYDYQYCEGSSYFVQGDTIDNVKTCTRKDIVHPYDVKTITEAEILKRDLGKLQNEFENIQRKIKEKQTRLDKVKDIERPLEIYEITHQDRGHEKELIKCDYEGAVYDYARNPMSGNCAGVSVTQPHIPCYTKQFIDARKREEMKEQKTELQRRVKEIDEELKKLDVASVH